MTIERVYVVGAGASVPYGLPTLKTLTRELYEHLDDERRAIIVDAVYEAFGVDLRASDVSPDFEELLNRLDPRPLTYLEGTGYGGVESSRRRAAEIAVAGLRSFFRDKCLQGSKREGPFDALVQGLTERTMVVSFNWDVLLELALQRAGREYTYLPTERSAGAIPLLKPHGSINWFALLDRELLLLADDSNLACFGDDLSHYLLYLKDPLAQIEFGESSPFLQSALARVPTIVLPAASKPLAVGGAPRDGWVEGGHVRAIQATWNAFKIGLDQARDLVVIGYSLPGTDAASIELLKHFAGDGLTSKRLVLVDPQASVADRYRRLLNVRVDVACADFKNFRPEAL